MFCVKRMDVNNVKCSFQCGDLQHLKGFGIHPLCGSPTALRSHLLLTSSPRNVVESELYFSGERVVEMTFGLPYVSTWRSQLLNRRDKLLPPRVGFYLIGLIDANTGTPIAHN